MITVDNKFEVGQEVFIIKETIKSVRNELQCSICEGLGEIIYKGYKLRCPNCNNGVDAVSIDRVKMYAIADKGKITSIRFQYANKDSSSIKYKVCGRWVSEEMAAITDTDAIALCEELNTMHNPEPIS